MKRIVAGVWAAVFVTLAGHLHAAPPVGPGAPAGKEQADAAAWCDRAVDTYMHSKWTDLDAQLKAQATHNRFLTAEQRSDLAYIRKSIPEHRPAWWKDTKSSSNKTFQAAVWGKPITVNYMPSEFFGGMMPVDIDEKTNRLRVIVTWQPHQVDSTKALDDEFATPHGLTEADEAEAVVWHELGHSYVVQGLPADIVEDLYVNHRLLFSAVQEFYADCTVLYHASPQARKAALIIRVPELRWNDVNDPHVRGAYSIGAFVLATVLADPAKWPSFRLPTTVPEKEVERSTLFHMYTHLDSGYTLDEDRRFRELIGALLRNNGAAILKSKGTLKLPNRLEFKCMTAEDRDNQTRRDAWVKAELEKAIASGVVKKSDSTRGHPKKFRITAKW